MLFILEFLFAILVALLLLCVIGGMIAAVCLLAFPRTTEAFFDRLDERFRNEIEGEH